MSARGRDKVPHSRRIEGSSEGLDTLLEWAPDAMVVIDTAGRIVMVNRRTEEMFGYSRDELIAQPIEKLIPLHLGTRHAEHVQSFFADPSNRRMGTGRELTGLSATGLEFPVEISLSPVEMENDELVVGSMRDISSRKQAESQLRKANAQADTALALSKAVCFEVAPDMQHFTASDSYVEMMGLPPAEDNVYSVAETYASNVAALSPAYAEDFGAKAMKALQGETETIDVSHPFRRPVDGRIIWLHSIAIVIRDENEKVTEIHGVAQDITDLMEMNQQLEAARDAAEASTRAKSSFLANMSHELRTPMNAIIGYSEMLAEELEDEELDGFIPDVKKIHAAGQHLLALINDILDLSKIEAGRMDLYLEHFDFQKLLTEAQDTVMPLIEKNGNRLETNFDEDIGSVRADMTKVRQSLFNLLSNAAKFTHEGVIRIEARRENRDGRDTVVLSVSDSGIGIPEDRIDHVFEEFSQADQSTTKDYGGTGLGLAISRRFCRMMGGDLTATSVVGEGSTFTMVFPAKVDALEAAKAAGERKEGSAAPGSDARLPGSGHVLVIDDDPEAREILRRSLEAEGLQVLTADSGAQGLEIALEKQPSVITLDVLMPGMDGWQVLRELKRDDELSHIPVVLVTMLDDKGLGFALGAADYLTKPVNREVLRRSVRNQIHDDASGHALIVDDDDGVREVVRRTLESEGWRVDEAANGRIGLDRVSDKTPDLIILDLMMPVMDGFDFMQELRTRHEHHIPTVILTAKELSLEEKKFLEGQEYQVLAKGNDGIASVPALVKAAIDGTRRTA